MFPAAEDALIRRDNFPNSADSNSGTGGTKKFFQFNYLMRSLTVFLFGKNKKNPNQTQNEKNIRMIQFMSPKKDKFKVLQIQNFVQKRMYRWRR